MNRKDNNKSVDNGGSAPQNSSEGYGSTTGDNSKPGGRRSRPSRSRRQKNDPATEFERFEEHEATKTPKGGNPKGTSKGSSSKPIPLAPQPGKYPVLFDAEIGKPVHEMAFSVSWDVNVSNHYSVLDCFRYAPGWNTYRAELAQGLDDTENRKFEGEFVAAGVLTTAQNIVKTVKDNHRDIQGMSALDTTDIVHTSANRTVSSQYGVTKMNETGEVLVPADLKQGSRKAVRASRAIRQQCIDAAPDIKTEAICRSIASRAWLPSSLRDCDFDNTLRSYLQDWLDQRNYDYISIMRNLPILTGHDPPWRQAILPAQWPEIKWIFTARPETVAQWMTRINAIPAEFYEHTSCPRPIDNNGVNVDVAEGDFAFDLDDRAELSRIADSWANKAPILFRHFHTFGKAGCTSSGTSAQLASHSSDHDLIEYSNYITNSSSEASMAACFPPKIHLPCTRREQYARGICTMNKDEVMAQWVTKAIK
jgi:hypothetical protein